MVYFDRTAKHESKYYLAHFDYEKVTEEVRDAVDGVDTEILVSVVCNLRNYYLLSQEETVRLVVEVFNRVSWEAWSPESVSLAWELVEGFTPTLGVSDEQTAPKRRADLIENETVDLIAWTEPGGKVSCKDLLKVFNQWNPDIAATKRELGVAVSAVTGMESKGIHGVRYWVGFHLPSDEELSARLLAAAA